MKVIHQIHTEPLILHNQTINYEPHLHQEVEIITLFEGAATATVNGTDYPLCAGDTLIVFPNAVHSYVARGAIDVGKFIFAADAVGDLKAVLTGMTPRVPLISADHQAAGILHRLAHDIIRDYRTASAPVQTAYLSLLAGKLLELCELEAQTYTGHNTVDLILTYCRRHFRRELSLESVAAELGLSKSHLSHIFSGKIKMDFRNYLNTLRLGEAYPLLTGTDLPITEIADRCGFSSLRTFDRTFREQNGVSPSAYRKQAQRR